MSEKAGPVSSPTDMKALGVVLGDLVEVTGKKKTVAR